MDWDKVKTFYHVAKAGSFSRASNIMNLSQSALSRQILDLEHSLQKKLFLRVAKGVRLTKAGRELLITADNMIKEVQKLEGKNTIKLLASIEFSEILEQCVINLAQIHKKIDFQLNFTNEPYDSRALEADFYLSSTPNYLLNSKKLGCLEMALYASQTYLKKNGTVRSIDDLQRRHIFTYPLEPITSSNNWHINIINSKTKTIKLHPYIQVNSYYFMRNLITQGIGIGSLFVCKQNNSLTKVLPKLFNKKHNIFCSYNKDGLQDKISQDFFALLNDYFTHDIT